MTRVGIRQLRQDASRYVRLVAAGETVEIVDRGRPVALMVPIPPLEGIARLEAEGRISAAAGDVLDLGPPLKPRRGVPLPSVVLARMREDER